MRDLNRKVDKFIKEKSASAKKPRAASPTAASPFSPTVSYGVNSATQSVTKITKKVNSRTFSMTVSFNPRFDKPFLKDENVYHEDQKQRNNLINVDRAKSPKRDPILQNNQEPCFAPRPLSKQSSLYGKMTIFDEEAPVNKRADGECKDMNQARSLSPRVESIKTYAPDLRGEESPDKRLRKPVKSPHKNIFNPITEGDPQSVNANRLRKEAPSLKPSEQTKKLNDRKQLLQTDIGFSPKGRVFRETSLTESAKPIEKPASAVGRRMGSPDTRKAEMKGLLEYNYSLPYRQEAISPKCNKVPYSEVVKGIEK